jgi:aryl-alcohol dehydrogenase
MQTTAALTNNHGAGFVPTPLELDEPRADEVRVAIKAAGICHTDFTFADGHAPSAVPAVFGHEGVGVVEAVGSDVEGIEVGDRVLMSYDSCGGCPSCLAGRPFYCALFAPLNFGGARLDGSTSLTRDGNPIHSHFFGQSSFSDRANVRARTIVHLGDDIPFELAAPFACGIMTGAGAVINSMKAGAGSRIAVIGLGGVGLAAVIASKLVDAGLVIAIDPVEVRRTLALELGAHVALDPTLPTFTDDLKAHGGVDFVLDTAGRTEPVDACFANLIPGGTLFTVTAPPAGSWSLPAFTLIEGRGMRGITMGEAVPQTFIPFLIEKWRAGQFPIERLVSTFPMKDIAAAEQAMRSHHVIKPVLINS